MKSNALRAAIARQQRLAMQDDGVGGWKRALGNDCGCDDFPPDRIRNPDDGRVDYAREGEKHALDLGRVYVLTAADDHLALSPGEVEEPIGIPIAEIAAIDPAVADRLRRL